MNKRITAIILVIAMLATAAVSGTMALFTDGEINSGNRVSTGSLDVEMYYADSIGGETVSWTNVETAQTEETAEGEEPVASAPIFSYQNWEPGYTDVKYIKIVNNGDYAFRYGMSIVPTGNVGELAKAIEVYYIAEPQGNITGRDALGEPVCSLYDLMNNTALAYKSMGVLLPALRENETAEEGQDYGEIVVAVALRMDIDAGNEYQGASVGDSFALELYATQYTYEEDDFGSDYDAAATFPNLDIWPMTITVPVETAEDGTLAEAVEIRGLMNVGANVPAGVKLAEGVKELSLTISLLENTTGNVTPGEGEEMCSFDVHIEGVAADNTTPILVDMGAVLPIYMNQGNVAIYHVENGVTNAMTQVASLDELDAHNEFYYDLNTGELTVAMATFSEVTMTVDPENAWNGGTTAFTLGEGTETDPYIIVNADQLAYMNKLISASQETDAHYKLISDINFGGSDSSSIWYPIGYWAEGEGLNSAGETWYTYGDAFQGVFDGTGHTITGIYQNTWAMDGNYDNGYWKAAMGLFGYVNGGTVKNLTIDNFYSEGEFAPTGCVTAYAAGEATFENIAIINSHPQTYNTGVAGIVGWDNGGDTEAEASNFTFKNITVDSSNTISALWGSWDVAAAGLLGYLGEYSKANLTNCNVSATIDVYNDVCGNYQYYWYRYCGMLIGTVDKTNTDGSLNLSNITATNCTVNFGDRHEYYYCEYVKNSLASYTHDHQFSRVPHSDLNFTDINGNGRVDTAEVDSVTGCNHDHETPGYEKKDIDGDGVIDSGVLLEDKQAVHIPFYQLFGGYGWGVDGVALDEYNYGLDITSDRYIATDAEASVVKFEIADTAIGSYADGTTVTIGELFAAVTNVDPGIKTNNVQVFVSPVVEKNGELKSTAGGTYTANTTDWTKGTLTFTGTGAAQIIITDYYYCKNTVLDVTITERQAAEKFETKFTGDFLYRVGNENTVTLSSLFEALDGVKIGNVSVTVETVNGTAASGTYTPNTSDWTQGTIQFSGTGVVKVTINDDDVYCIPTVLNLEVVDAVNVTSATSATAKSVVLLNDCGFSSLEVSGGYTLYGNGFTMTCASDSVALDMGYSFVTLDNGTLDNVQIVCPNFDYAALYKDNLISAENRSVTDSNGKTRYYNARSGVMVSGYSQILNSRISGARAAVNVSGGNVVIDNSRIELGAVASLLVNAANSLTLRDVTLVQKPTASTYDSNKTLMGFSVLVICSSDGSSAPITLEGTLVQNAWVDESDKQYVPSAGQSIISTVLEKIEYLHDLDGDGTKESLNLGFAYMPESLTSKVNTTTITDNRTNKDTVPYGYAEVTILSGKTYVYSYKSSDDIDDSFKTESEYVPNKYSDIITVTYSDTAEGLTTGKSYGTDGWVYELNVDLDKLNGYALDFSKLSMLVNGVPVDDFLVNGNAKPTSPVAVTAGGTTYELTATVEDKEYTATYKVTGTETSKESPSLVGTPSYGAGFGVANKYGGDWSAAAPVLDGITIRYWSVADSEYKEFALSSIVFANTGKQNGTNNYWEYTHTNNDFTLKLTNTVVMHSNSGTYGMPVAGKDGKLYFTIASSGGFVSTGTTSRSITMSYEFTDNNGGDTLKFGHTWSIPYSKDEQYNYSSFTSDGTLTKLEGSSGSDSTTCITPETLITLADGSQKEVQYLTGEEELLVWNLETGAYDAAPIVFVDSDAESEYEIIHLGFSDGSDVEVIYEHGFFDLDLGEYVYIDASNAADYVGHRFVTQGSIEEGTWNVATLTEAALETRVTTAWSPVTYEHLCYYVDGVLSMPGGIDGLFNIFEVDTDIMAYDEEAMAEDIETYGLFTYEDFGGMIPEEAFDAFNGDYLKVAMGKGMLTWEDIEALAERYIPLM